MRILLSVLIAVILLGCVTPSQPFVRPESWGRQVMGTGLDNFYRVDEHLFRSSQPGRDDVPSLEKLGIRSVLNLRNFHDDEDEFRGSDILLMRLPLNAGEVTEADLLAAVKLIKRAPGPVLVHCWHGSDRTGAVVAAWRMLIMGWSKEEAIREFKEGGYGYHETFYPNLETLLRELDVNKLKQRLTLGEDEAEKN